MMRYTIDSAANKRRMSEVFKYNRFISKVMSGNWGKDVEANISPE